MNKERKVIEPNAIVVFDRDVRTSELNALFKDFHGDIVINGVLLLYEENLCISCDNLYVEYIAESYGPGYPEIKMKGNLYVNGDCGTYDIKVNGSVYCQGNVSSTNIDIAEDFFVEGDVDAYNKDVHVGGDFTCEGSIESVDSLKVLGKFKVDGSLNNVTDICIG